MAKRVSVLWVFPVLLFLCPLSATGQSYPSRMIRIVASEAGSGGDLIARVIAQELASVLGQPLIVDNRGGGVIAGELVAKAAPDGHTLLSYGNTLWLLPLMRSHVSYDPIKDFAPITLAVTTPNILVVHPSIPVGSVKELIVLARAKPGELNYSSAAAGTPNHLAAELFKSMAGLNIVRVPFKGHASALNSLLGGEVQLMFAGAGPGMVQVKAGKLRVLAVTSIEPTALAPNVPTMAASGLPGYEAVLKSGIFAPARTPASIISRLNAEIARLLERTETKERLFNAGLEAVGNSPEQFAAMIAADVTRMGKVIRDAGIRDE